MNVQLGRGSMSPPGEIYNKGGTDKTGILAVRAQAVYPIIAPGWTDLRIGFFLSLTQTVADDTITGIVETITNSSGLAPQDRYWIGIKYNDARVIPKSEGTGAFVGFTNASREPAALELHGDSVLSDSDGGIGTTNSNFWRPNNSDSQSLSGGIWDGAVFRDGSQDGVQQHFPQNATGAGGYALLLALRLRRSSGTSKTITVTTKTGVKSADILYTNTPTSALIRSNLESFPSVA